MTRLRRKDYGDRRAQIKALATREFATKGYHGTSITDIAKACDTVKSRLYYYFPSKADLLYEILDDHAKYLQVCLLPLMDTDERPEDKLRAYALNMIKINIEHRDQHKLILSEIDALDSQRANDIRARLRTTIETLYPVLQQINPDSRTHPFASAMMFVGQINWTHTWYEEGGDLTAETYAGLVCDTFLNGYSA